MAMQETNFMEIVLRSNLLNMTIYEDFGDGNGKIPIQIKHLTYDPVIEHVYISDHVDPDDPSANTYKMSIKENFDFEYDNIKKIKPNKRKIKGKRNR